MCEFRFTIFTATYNRAEYLSRVYNSLKDQTFDDFEWLVVDDGSTDNTEELINSFIAERVLKSIKYIKKGENGGKHTAWRVATDLFNAKYVITLDSDDTLTPHALEIFDKYWRELENSPEYESFWEVKGRVQDEKGQMIGTPLPQKVFDSTTEEILYKYKIKGEMEGCRKVNVLQNEAKVPDNFLFDNLCSNFGESIRWVRANKKYKTRYFDEIVRTYFSDADESLCKSNKRERNIKKTYNNLVLSYYTLLESREAMIRWDKSSYLKSIAVLLYTSFCLRINPTKLINEKMHFLDKFLMYILILPMFILYKIRK